MASERVKAFNRHRFLASRGASFSDGDALFYCEGRPTSVSKSRGEVSWIHTVNREDLNAPPTYCGFRALPQEAPPRDRARSAGAPRIPGPYTAGSRQQTARGPAMADRALHSVAAGEGCDDRRTGRCDRGLAQGPASGFGVHALRSGIPLNLLQRWLGHADIATTAIYADAMGPEERAIAARMWAPLL